VRVNPRRRKLRQRRPERPYLDRAEQIAALLDAAGELDAEARTDRQATARRALLATLAFAGLRIGEALALRWRDVDLAGGRLRVGRAKTDAGVRTVELLPALRDELTSWKARTRYGHPAELAFGTENGREQSPSRPQPHPRQGGQAGGPQP
jgi:integrase